MTVEHASIHLTNATLGKLIGLDHSSASRLRRGERGASTAVMVKIEEVFGWPVRDQFKAVSRGSFAADFGEYMTRYASTHRPNRDTPGPS